MDMKHPVVSSASPQVFPPIKSDMMYSHPAISSGAGTPISRSNQVSFLKPLFAVKEHEKEQHTFYVVRQHHRNESDHIWRPIHSSLKRRKRMFMELFDWGLWEISITQCSSTSTTLPPPPSVFLSYFFPFSIAKWRIVLPSKTQEKGDDALCSRNFQNVKFRLDYVEI